MIHAPLKGFNVVLVRTNAALIGIHAKLIRANAALMRLHAPLFEANAAFVCIDAALVEANAVFGGFSGQLMVKRGKWVGGVIFWGYIVTFMKQLLTILMFLSLTSCR